MDENKSLTGTDGADTLPAEPETAVPAPAANETLPVDPALEDAQDDEEEYDEEEDDETVDPEDDPNRDYMDDVVIGMPRMCFYGTMLGFGGGVVVAGLVGMLFHREITAVTMFGILGGGVGYLIARQLDKRRRAQRDAKQNEQSPQA